MHNKQNEIVEKLSLVKSNNSNKTKANTLIEKINKKKIARLKRKQKQVENFQTKLENTDETSKGKVEKPDLKDTIKMSNKQTKKLKLMNLLKTKTNFPKTDTTNKKKKPTTLKERMMEKLKTSRFRYLNEQIYNSEGKKAQQFFQSDPDAFHAYHDGYSQQVTKWPLNPLNNIIKSIKKMPSDYVIADFGCGEANLAKSVSQKVHSFDFVAMNEYITPCDMAHVPLENESVNVAVFCLSLMGTNIRDYLYEANRVLKTGGKLKIAEVESRFDKVEVFIEGVKKFGFKYVWKDLSHKLFYFIDFEKISKCKPLSKLPTIGLHPCLYKKR